MRHKLALIICILAVAATAYAVRANHTSALRQLTIQNAKTAALQAKAKVQAEIAAHDQAEATQSIITKLEAQCQQGVTAYNNLTAFAKTHMAKPDCSVQ